MAWPWTELSISHTDSASATDESLWTHLVKATAVCRTETRQSAYLRGVHSEHTSLTHVSPQVQGPVCFRHSHTLTAPPPTLRPQRPCVIKMANTWLTSPVHANYGTSEQYRVVLKPFKQYRAALSKTEQHWVTLRSTSKAQWHWIL